MRYLKFLIKDNNGDLRQALLDYNGGPNRSSTSSRVMRYADQIMIALGAKFSAPIELAKKRS